MKDAAEKNQKSVSLNSNTIPTNLELRWLEIKNANVKSRQGVNVRPGR